MAQMNVWGAAPRLAVAFVDVELAERLVRELRSRIPGIVIASFDGETALLKALSVPISIDILIIDSALSDAAATLMGDDAPVAAVFIPADSTESFAQVAAKTRFAILQEASEPRPFAEVSGWVSGAAAAIAKGSCASHLAHDYGQRYEDLVHALPDIVYELDIDGVITFINDSVSLLGYKPADLVGKHYSVLLHDDDAIGVDRERVLPDYLGYRTGHALSPKLFNERRNIDRRTTDLEVRLRRKPGAPGSAPDVIGSVIAYGEVSSVGEYGRSGKDGFKGTVGIIRDVTLRRKSEEMLRKLYQAIDQLGSCVFVLNHAFEVEYVNPAFFLLTGFAPPDVIGRNVFRFFAFMPDKVDSIAKRVQDGFEAREESLVPRASGGQFWANFSMAPVRSPSGAITHAIAIVEDVSSRKSMEELLLGARSEAEEANRAKSRFLSSMTHELKNPISGIMAAARLLQLDPESAGAKASSILENAQTLLDILSGILDFVRSENSAGSIQRLAFPLGGFMERVCLPYRAAAEAKGLAFRLAVESDDVLESDPDRLDRVIGILIDNAVKYTERGSITVVASMEKREGNVPHLRVRVADTGAGIDASERDMVFVPFARYDSRSRVMTKGAGIGLALAKNIVRVLGGEIRVDSQPGVGSEFSVIVPAAAPIKSSISAAARYTVLVVDDNEVNLEYMRTLIENCGYRVHCALSAAEAFRVLETKYVDAALLDIQMPGFSGTELAKAIRAYAGPRYSPNMPLFAMTAHDSSVIDGADWLFKVVFPKPTDIRKFSSALSAAMAEIEAVSMVEFSESFSNRAEARAAALAKIGLDVEEASTALSLALTGTIDARVDIRAEAASLTNAFRRFSCPSGQKFVELFIEHYTDEDKSVLAGLLERMVRMIGNGIAAMKGSIGE